MTGWFAEASESLVVLSWNVQNYTLADRYLYERYQRDYPKPEAEKEALRKTLKDLNPDIVLLQEIGGDDFLNELVIDLRDHEALDYPYHASLASNDEERRLGLLSKIPFEWVNNGLSEKTFTYLGNPIPLKRGLLEIRVTLDGRELTLMEMHLKSRITTEEEDPDSGIRREKEARLIRDYIRELLEREPVKAIILMGDLNDHPRSSAYRRITQVADQKLLCELPVQDDRGDMWTYFYRQERRYEQIDYAFVSPDLLNPDKWHLDASIMGGESVRLASDHRPILMTIKTFP